jgi:hypothetical protein
MPRVEDLVHVGEDELVLLHVEPAHVLGQAGGRRLHAREVVGRLRAVAQRQVGLGVQFARLLHDAEQVLDGDVAEHVTGPAREAHVALDEPAIGPADLGEHFTGVEMDDLVEVETVVRFAPAGNRDVQHE